METETITITVEVSKGYADLVQDRLWEACMETRNTLRDLDAPVRNVSIEADNQTQRLSH